ncbi:lipopolysaccharide biosynthesis protein [Lacibacter sediminis]|uniref:Polysaccharide biosynthesis C-terminal domain-containing protein n=1 Tax=Lacibacter sediminis TaxID=2760713 RepID=A0A7G5XME7_9BACT|nr:polysaccharide biosynthesis C-terminal domain-containing protein [Lacibacter sediminis]QNA46650.1 polysaccharide biosynthesis C-terminal domain-containing protein [Lacibacter sediminis]
MKLATALSKSILWRGFYFLSVMLLNVLVARHFQSDGSGQIYYIINLLAFTLIIISLCLEAPMGYYLSQQKMNETQLAAISVAWTILIMLPGWFIIRSLEVPKEGILQLAGFHFSATAFLTGNLLITFFVALFYAKMDFVLPNLLLVAVNLLLIILVPNNEWVQGFMSSENYVQLYFLGFFMQGFSLMIAFLFRYFKFSDLKRIPAELIKPFLSFALIAVVTNAMTFLMYRIDYWFVNKYCDDADLGNYIQACKLAQLFFVVPSILAAVVFPMTASGRREEMNEKMQLLSRGLILSYCIACGGLVALGYWLFPFVFGETFDNMYVPFVLLVPAILSYSVIHLLAAYYSGKKVLSVNFKGNLIALVIIVVGDMLVIPRFGITGAAIVSSIGYISYMSFILLMHRKEYKSRFADFLFFRKKDGQLFYKLLMEKISSRKTDVS